MSRLDEIQNVSAIDFNRALDFCVWALEQDGLHVPPFDQHSGGTGHLCALGLDEAGWRAWVQAVASAIEERVAYQAELAGRSRAAIDEHLDIFQDHLRDLEASVSAPGGVSRLRRLKLARPVVVSLFTDIPRAMLANRRVRRSVPVVGYPDSVALWPGKPTLREELERMHDRYKAERRSARRRSWKSMQLLEYLASSRFTEFSRDIAARQTRGGLPPLVCIVNYRGPIVEPLTESIVVIGARSWDADPATFERVVLEAMDLLPAA